MFMRSTSVLFVLLAASAPLLGEEPAVIRLSEPVVVTDTYEVFGSAVEPGAATRLAEVIADEDQYLGKQVRVEARVAKVCQRKGCFFIAQDGESVARITFVDYSFFVPTDSGGKTVTIVGTFDRQTLSEDQARHYAQDAGGDPARVRGPQAEYSIVATSVIVPRS